MNKKTAQEQLTAMQVEMDKLKAIIDTPEVKAGRVMDVNDLDNFFYVTNERCQPTRIGVMHYDAKKLLNLVSMGVIFHDEKACSDYIEYLKLEQELRIAQAARSADGKGVTFNIILDCRGNIITHSYTNYHHKVFFYTQKARDRFRNKHTDEQLTLLIRGV